MSDMKLSEELQENADSFKRFPGCEAEYESLAIQAEKVRALEDRVAELERIAYPKYSD
jgi:hypothetical protein